MRDFKKAAFTCLKMLLVLSILLGLPFGAQSAAAAEKPVLIQDKANPNHLTLRNGQNALIINGELVNVGDSGKGWSYPEKDLLKLTGGASIQSILITDDLDENTDPTLMEGTRNFTIEVTGTNTISGSMKTVKDIAVELSGGTVDPNGVFLGTTVLFPFSGVNVLGSITLTGTGTLVLENDKKNPLPIFINAMGNVTIDGPAIKADMQSLKNYYHVISACAFSFDDYLLTGKINILSGSLEVENAGSKYSAVFAGKGMTLAEGAVIKAGKSASKAKEVTYKKFWNFEEQGDLVGPSPKNYPYFLIRAEQKDPAAPEKASISRLESAKKGELTVTIDALENVDGYQIVYSTSSKFSSSKTVTTTKTTAAIKSLSAGKKYYVKVRAYRLDSKGKKQYGTFGAAKTITIKK